MLLDLGDGRAPPRRGQTVPAALDQENAGMLRQLQQASGSDFDTAYVEMRFDGDQRAVALFNSYAQAATTLN
jgi:predicted outer membrane protein